MAIISLGIIDKKLLLPLFYIIVKFSNQIYWHYHKYNIVSLFIGSFGYSVGQIITIFLKRAFKYTKIHKNIKTFKKSPFKDIFFLFLFEIFYAFGYLFQNIFISDEEKTEAANQLYIYDAIEIIFITIITYFILKYKYYKHHLISITAFVLFAIIIDISLWNFSNSDSLLVITSILYILGDTLLFSYFKYLLEFKYYYFLDLLLINGIINFCIYLFSFLILLFIPDIQDSKTIITLFSEYYEQLGIWSIIFQILLCIFIFGFLDNLLQALILDELTPNHLVIVYVLGRIPISIIKNEGVNRWIILIISIFQTICLLFYIEIFECNFCSLNKNTKRNILERESRWDEEYNNGDEDEVSYGGYIITEIMNKNETIEESEDIGNTDDNS